MRQDELSGLITNDNHQIFNGTLAGNQINSSYRLHQTAKFVLPHFLIFVSRQRNRQLSLCDASTICHSGRVTNQSDLRAVSMIGCATNSKTRSSNLYRKRDV